MAIKIILIVAFPDRTLNMPVLFEFKARSSRNYELEALLQSLQPRFAGEDYQIDTYFNVSCGRLKLREGNIENALIHYQRSNDPVAKRSDVLLYRHQPEPALKDALVAALGVKVVVEKRRRIWFVDNVKIHFDKIECLGEFIEVEAIDTDGSIDIDSLQDECLRFAVLFDIKKEDYIAHSYSDLLLELH